MLGLRGGVRGLASARLKSRRASVGGVSACYDTRMLGDFSVSTLVSTEA